jgi:hypothetical protein
MPEPLAISIDTAMLSANHYGSLAGFKIQDPNATNPWDGLPLKKMQSVDMIIPTCLLAAKETKESFQMFQPFFEQTLALGKNNPDVNPLLKCGYKPFDLAVDCDMSAAFKGVCKGGNLKNSHFGCHMCAIEKEELANPNSKWTLQEILQRAACRQSQLEVLSLSDTDKRACGPGPELLEQAQRAVLWRV